MTASHVLPDNADAMPQGMETSRRYSSHGAFLRDAERMTSSGWALERVAIGPARYGRAARWMRLPTRSGVTDAHYLRWQDAGIGRRAYTPSQESFNEHH